MTRAAKTTFCYLLLSTVEVMKGNFPKKKISKQALYEMNWNEISINQAEKIQECMSLSNHHLVLTQCYLQLVPLELFVGAHPFICRLKLRTWYVLRWSQMPRIGLMGAATFHWFDVACDRNARRKCSFATFRGLGEFGWWCWWNKGALVPNFSNVRRLGTQIFSKSKLQNLFFLLDIVPTSTLSPSFGSNSALRKTCLSTEFMKQNLGSLEGTENRFLHLFTTDSFFEVTDQ